MSICCNCVCLLIHYIVHSVVPFCCSILHSSPVVRGAPLFHYCEIVNPTYSHLCTVSSTVYSGYLLSAYSCEVGIRTTMEYGVKPFLMHSLLSPLFLSTGVVVWRFFWALLQAHFLFPHAHAARVIWWSLTSYSLYTLGRLLSVSAESPKHTIISNHSPSY